MAMPLRKLTDIMTLEDTFNVNGRGRVYVGRLLRDFTDDTLLGLEVEHDGEVKRIIGVEAFAIPRPWRLHANVGILLGAPKPAAG